MFRGIFSEEGKHDAFKHLAVMVALLGNPPAEFVKRSETTEQCFDTGGKIQQSIFPHHYSFTTLVPYFIFTCLDLSDFGIRIILQNLHFSVLSM